MQSLKMESPAKKLDFSASNKENAPFDSDLAALEAEIDANHKSTAVVKKQDEPKPAVASSIKALEADEPLLQENPQRFVLFPIKYHEVRCATPPLQDTWNEWAKG